MNGMFDVIATVVGFIERGPMTGSWLNPGWYD